MTEEKPRPVRSRGRALEQSLEGINSAIQQSLFAEQVSNQDGFLQGLDPRVKIIGALGLIISVSLSRNIPVILGIYLWTLVLAALSALSPAILLRRVLLALLVFTVPVSLPALFLTPGPALVHLPMQLIITRPGAEAATMLITRAGAAVTLALLLLYTTPWNSVLAGLRRLGLPGVFTLMLGMTYRYLFLLLGLASDLFTARKSRVVGRVSRSSGRRIVASAAGALLERSLKLSGEVHLAMESRGFRGSTPMLQTLQMRPVDWVVLLASLVLTGLAIGLALKDG